MTGPPNYSHSGRLTWENNYSIRIHSVNSAALTNSPFPTSNKKQRSHKMTKIT